MNTATYGNGMPILTSTYLDSMSEEAQDILAEGLEWPSYDVLRTDVASGTYARIQLQDDEVAVLDGAFWVEGGA